jgi:hypothetical protein
MAVIWLRGLVLCRRIADRTPDTGHAVRSTSSGYRGEALYDTTDDGGDLAARLSRLAVWCCAGELLTGHAVRRSQPPSKLKALRGPCGHLGL